jgi:hypothetical protein
MEPEMRNAIIESTMLGIEDHGILTALILLDFGGSGQGFGGYALDTYNIEKGERVPSPGCGFFIQRVLEVVGVERWEELPHKHVRVIADGGKVHAIGHIIKNKWFYPEKEFKALYGEK